MLVILMFSMGFGMNIVIFIVFLYVLFFIIKNMYIGINEVDLNIKDVGKGMGMMCN